MNTLFTRTFLWFLATVILTFAALIAANALDWDEGGRRRPPFGAMVTLQFSEARNAFETGGPEALERTLRRFRQSTDTEGVLTDGSGRDLVTGQVRTDLAEAARRRQRSPFLRRDRTVIARFSRDGQYVYFLLLHRSNLVRWFLQPELHLTVLAVLALLSYAFARYLTNPVRQLQTAVEGFGRGDFRLRVRSARKDEIGQLARTFDRMADRIETLLSAERRLLLDISHELRSPLARLALATELARSGEDVDRHLNRIDRETNRLNDLVGELLQVTRAEGDEGLMRRDTVQLAPLLTAVAEDARIEAEQRSCRIELATPPPVEMQGDAELLRRVFENVLRNAIRYTDPGTAVIVLMERRVNDAIIQVRDHGPGVPEEHLARIFDPFYRVESDRGRVSGGAGLGLAIARRAVELHRGRIRAENACPGLLVEIALPVPV